MDKIEVTQNARQAAFDAYLTCYEIVPNDLWLQALLDGKHDSDEMAQAFARFERDILATRTDATPVAWMYRNKQGHVCAQFVQGLMDLDHWTEAPLYAGPPATDVAALVEALQEVISATCDYLPPDGISEQDCLNRVIGATDNPKIIAALAPFTKGQPHD